MKSAHSETHLLIIHCICDVVDYQLFGHEDKSYEKDFTSYMLALPLQSCIFAVGAAIGAAGLLVL